LADASRVLPVRHLQTHYRALDQGLVAPLAPVLSVPVHSFPGVWRAAPVREHVAEGGVVQQVAAAVELVVEHARRTPEESLLLLADDEATAEDLDLALRARLSAAEGDDRAAPTALLDDAS